MSAPVQSRTERRIHSLWLNTKGYADKALAVLTPASGAFWGLNMPAADDGQNEISWLWEMPDGAKLWFWVTVVLGVLWALAAFLLQRPRYAELLRQRDEAIRSTANRADALEQAIRSVLRQLAVHCKADGNDFRTSVYYYHQGKFIGVARYSKHPEFAQFRDGKSHHDVSAGVIGAAWNGTEYYKSDLPATRSVWEKKICELFGYSPAQVSAFRMQSRSYAAIRIEAHEGAAGVLVLESTQPGGVSKSTIKDAQGSLIRAALAEVVAAHAALTPQVEKAEEVQPARPPKGAYAIKLRPWKQPDEASVAVEVASSR